MYATHSSHRSQPHPLDLRLLFVLCAVFLLTGLMGHDLWKYEDAVNLGVVWDMAHRGHWLNPHLAGLPWAEAPLYYWLAAALGQLLGGVLGFHNAARLATAVFGAIALYALGRAAALSPAEGGGYRDHRDSTAPRFNAAAPLLLISAPGLLLPIHDAQPMIAVLAGHALAYWGLALLPAQRRGILLLLAGVLLSALAGGYDALLPLAALPLLPLLAARWRSRGAVFGLAVALAASALILALLQLGPAHPLLPPLSPFDPAPSRDHLELLGWFAWPALPLALWPLWLFRRQLGLIALPLLGSCGALVWFFLCSETRNLPALPLLLPLALLAATGAGRLRRGAANALDWFGMMTFTLCGIFLWLAEAALLTGTPPKLHRNITRLIPGYDSDVSMLAWSFAAAVSIIWLLIIFGARRSPWRASVNWACGTILMWCLFVVLWFPPVDYGKSYGPMSRQIAARIGHLDDSSCVAGRNLGNAQRAALDYHAGLITRSGKAAQACNWLLVEGRPRRTPSVDAGWALVWEGARPSDREERYYLFRR